MFGDHGCPPALMVRIALSVLDILDHEKTWDQDAEHNEQHASPQDHRRDQPNPHTDDAETAQGHANRSERVGRLLSGRLAFHAVVNVVAYLLSLPLPVKALQFDFETEVGELVRGHR